MKYLLITATRIQENNIGVLQSSDLERVKHEKENLKNALAQHFDTEVEIKECKKVCEIPLQYEVKCSMADSDGEPEEFTTELQETWLY